MRALVSTNYTQAVDYLRAVTAAEPAVAKLSPPLREARIFAQILHQLPIGKIQGEILAGDYGMIFADNDFRRKAEKQPSVASLPTTATTTPDPFDELNLNFNCRTTIDPAHSTACYDLLVEQGLTGMIAELEAEKEQADPERQEYLAAEIMTLRAVCAWSERYAALGFDVCRRVPAQSPRTFQEAVQAIWLVHTAIGIGEKSYYSLSLGRIDQYLYPFYRADRDHGIAEEQLAATLTDLFLKLNRYGDASCAINLGGVSHKGKDLFNDLTRLIVKTATQLQLPAPLLAAHIHPGLSRDDFDLLTVPELFRIGQPSFYGEYACRKALIQRGVPEAEVHRWSVNSCMGLMMPGEEFSDMWGIVFTFQLPLELALNRGRPFQSALPFQLQTVCPERYDGTAAIIRTMLAYAEELIVRLIVRHRQINEQQGRSNPDPYLSALLRGGTLGRDRLLGGPRYHTVNVDTFALVNAADALTAIEQAVFRNRRWTLSELLAAAKNNFAGQEILRRELLSYPKYGNGDPAADGMARELAQCFAAIIRRHSDRDLIYMPSFHTLHAHVHAGSKWGASLDGRLAGEPFAKNVGPTQGRNKNGITGVLNSAAAIGQEFFYGGQALDLYIEAGLLDNPSSRCKLQDALQTYFKLGGLQVQVNGVSIEDLKKAMAEPEKYADLTVRIGGYSARFVDLAPDDQRQMIKRFEHHT
ncbi:MAG: hypothetical protein NT011_10680 [Kiritimatiellaeota bacterium]|nr:hypothetical protein [Kiritimatiellota bacterium]